MKRQMIMIIIAGILTVSLFDVHVLADIDKSIISKQQEFNNYSQEIDSKQQICYKLGGKIEELIREIDSNKEEMSKTSFELEIVENEISDLEEALKEKELELKSKIQNIYHVGGATGQGTILLNSNDSVGTFTMKLFNTNILLAQDKEVVEELASQKKKLDERIEELDERKKELEEISLENKKKHKEIEEKKVQQEVVIEQLKNEKNSYDEKYLSKEEEKVVTYYMGIIDLPISSYEDIKDSIAKLEVLRDNQLKSKIIIDRVNQYIEYGKLRLSESDYDKAIEKNKNKGSYIVEKAMEFIGTPYIWGANGPDSFDCSGFTKYIYENYAAITLTRTTYTQVLEGIEVEFEDLQEGDLVFTYNGDHVGIYVGGGNYINATQPNDVVRITKIEHFYEARRILEWERNKGVGLITTPFKSKRSSIIGLIDIYVKIVDELKY